MTTCLRRWSCVLLLGAVLALWMFGGRRQVAAPADGYVAMVGGIRATYDGGRIRAAMAAGESIEVVMDGRQVWWGSAADFMALVVDSVVHERQGER